MCYLELSVTLELTVSLPRHDSDVSMLMTAVLNSTESKLTVKLFWRADFRLMNVVYNHGRDHRLPAIQ